MIRRILTAAAAAAAIIAPAHAATIFTEGFETPDIAPRWFVFDTFGQFMTIDGAGIEIQTSGTVVQAYEGQQYVELDSHLGNGGDANAGTSNTSMAAFVNMIPTIEHTLSFAYRPRTNNNNDNGISVHVGNLVVDELAGTRIFTESQNLGAPDGRRNQQNFWDVISMTFVAGIGDNAIMFRAFGLDNTLGGFLDDVQVSANLPDINNPVPVPAAGLLLVTGLLGMARRRRA